ncbi:prepilin peptidase [Bacillus sp. NPDC094106]|uniref:prepilin peptidase n=1 Tax=Bacillus sp. NPDC094106 TaxID=3363949 RepID=UPI00380ADA7B
MLEIQRFFLNIKEEILYVNSHIWVVAIILGFLLVATYTDLKNMKIYHKFNMVFLLTRFALIIVPFGISYQWTHVFGGLIGFVFLLIPAMALMHKMGGDIRFMGILGMYLGGYYTIVLLFISCAIHFVYSMVTIFMLKREGKKTMVPFAPFFLIAYTMLTLLGFYVL